MVIYLSNRKFAKLCKVGPPAITKAIKDGRVWRTERGIDPDHPTNIHYQASGRRGPNRKSQEKKKRAATKKAKEKATATATPAPKRGKGPASRRPVSVEEVREEIGENDDEARRIFERALPPGDAAIAAAHFSRQSAEHLKVLESIREKQIKNDKARLELVERDLVRRMFGELYLIHTNQFKTMGDKLSPAIAAAAKVDDAAILTEIGGIIEKEVFRNLSAVKRMFSDKLKKIKAELPEEASA